MTKWIIGTGTALILTAGAFGVWYWLKHRKITKQVAKAAKAVNPEISAEEVEALGEQAFEAYLAEVRSHLSGSTQAQFDRLAANIKGLAKKAKSKVVNLVSKETEAAETQGA